MKLVKIKAFELDELQGRAREKALQWMEDRETCADFNCNDWSYYLIEDWKERMKVKGYIDPEVCWSGFGSQGDGASFTGKVDLTRWIIAGGDKRKKKYKKLSEDIRLGYCGANLVRIDRHYSHARTVSAQTWGDTDVLEKHGSLLEEMEKEIDAEAEKLANELYKQLYKEYFSITSEENLLDIARNNDILFNEDGEAIEDLIVE